MKMKKILIVVILSFVIIILFFAFRKVQSLEILPSQAKIGNNFEPRVFDSFKGAIDFVGFERPVFQANEESKPTTKSPFADNRPTEQKNETVLTFAVMGDTQSFKTGNSGGNFQTVVRDIVKSNVNLVFSTGDLTGSCESYTECLKKHNSWKTIAAPLISKTYAAMGNHDNINDKGVKAWQDAFNFPTNGPADFSKLVYSFDFENSHFVVLASDSPDMHKINEEQRSWLEKDLAASKKDNTFVFFHEPAFPVNSKVGESLDKNTEERDALWQIFDKYNVTAVFNGHEHIVSRRKIDSSVFPGAKNAIYQFVFGSTESFDHDLPDAGVAEYTNRGQGRFGIVKVSGKKITVEVHDSSDALLNSFDFEK
jgi:3',5'-cyclic-AMP phosphodiesterase